MWPREPDTEIEGLSAGVSLIVANEIMRSCPPIYLTREKSSPCRLVLVRFSVNYLDILHLFTGLYLACSAQGDFGRTAN